MSALATYSFEPVHVTLSGSTVTVVADQSINGYNLANAGAPQYEAISWNGYPAVVFDGTDDTLKQTTGLANDMIGGIDAPCTVFMAFQRTAQGASGDCFWSCGDNASINPMFRFVESSQTGGFRWEFRKRDAATGTGSGAGGLGAVADNNPHVMGLETDGTNCTIEIDGVTVFSGAMDVGDMGTMDTMALACLSRTTDSSFAAMRLWAWSAHDTVTAGEKAGILSLYEQYMPRGVTSGGDHFRRRV